MKAHKQQGIRDVLVLAYGFWAIAALSRALYQYLFRHPAIWMPTHLSAFVGLLYLLIMLAMRRYTPLAWLVSVALLCIELGGVLIVGMLDVVWKPFPYATVWSGFGAGYLFVPLVLPILGLFWMTKRTTRECYGYTSVSVRQLTEHTTR
ncbi:MAG TPA: hypothetical protein VFT99_14100 [Roseiflexaceae bacterium]|nr:hypothetical protein [Roseiflexaceae bacterium]